MRWELISPLLSKTFWLTRYGAILLLLTTELGGVGNSRIRPEPTPLADRVKAKTDLPGSQKRLGYVNRRSDPEHKPGQLASVRPGFDEAQDRGRSRFDDDVHRESRGWFGRIFAEWNDVGKAKGQNHDPLNNPAQQANAKHGTPTAPGNGGGGGNQGATPKRTTPTVSPTGPTPKTIMTYERKRDRDRDPWKEKKDRHDIDPCVVVPVNVHSGGCDHGVPEINAESMASALALLVGGALLLCGRRHEIHQRAATVRER
jgi:hypothetical protein